MPIWNAAGTNRARRPSMTEDASPVCSSGFQLPADFTALVGSAVDVNVKVPRLVLLVLRVCQLGAGGNRPRVAIVAFRQRDDDTTVFAWRTLVDMRSGAGDS